MLLFAALLGLGMPTTYAQDAASGLAYQTIPGVSPEPIREGAGLKSPQDLEAFLDGVMADQLGPRHIAGVTLAVVKDGKLFFAKGYGYADVGKQIPVDAQTTLFRPGSISKLFTWTALMQRVEQGRVALDADVNTYLTQFKIPATFPQPITVKNLLTHTEGLEDGALGYLIAKGPDDLVPLSRSLARHMPARVRPPVRDFGASLDASYSNWGAALAGLIVSNVSGMGFDEYIEKNILEPLGMTSSTFREPLPASLAPRMSGGYTYENGAFKRHGFEFIHNFGPAGSLSSTAADMAKFMIAHLQNGAYGDRRILREETARQMHRRQLSGSPYIVGMGLGFAETWINGRRLIWHNGGTLYFHSDLYLLPEENVGLFVSYNTAPTLPLADSVDLIHAFMNRYYPARLPRIKPPADFKTRAARYAGSYRPYRSSWTRNEKFSQLFSSVSVTPAADGTLLIGQKRWVEVKPGVFRQADGDATMAFVEDASGRMHLLPHALVASYKLRWYETAALHYFVLGFGALCFIVAVVSAARNWKRDRGAAPAARRARRLAALVGTVNLAFVVCAGLTFARNLNDLILAWPTIFYVALAFPLISLPLTAGMLYFVGPVWKTREWGRYGRVQYTVIAVMSATFLWSLNYWNLIGYKFG